MKKSLLLIFTLFLLISAVGIIAQESPTTLSEDDNECYTGGLMEGKCDTYWEWECGWYLHAWLDNGGWSNPDQFFPERCETVIPPKPKAPSSDSTPGEEPPSEPTPIPPTEICRTFNDPFGTVNICLRSNNTGDFSDDGFVFGRSVFGNFGGNPANCPPTPAGFFFDYVYDTEEEYSSETGDGYEYSLFTNNELFNVLNLGPDECYYEALEDPSFDLSSTSLSTGRGK